MPFIEMWSYMSFPSNEVPRAQLTVLPYLRREGEQVQLLGSECKACGFHTFPPTTVCPSCMGLDLKPLPLSAVGKLYSFTTIRYNKAETYGGYVDFPETVRVFGHLHGFSAETPPRCDMPVATMPGPPAADGQAVGVEFAFVSVGGA